MPSWNPQKKNSLGFLLRSFVFSNRKGWESSRFLFSLCDRNFSDQRRAGTIRWTLTCIPCINNFVFCIGIHPLSKNFFYKKENGMTQRDFIFCFEHSTLTFSFFFFLWTFIKLTYFIWKVHFIIFFFSPFTPFFNFFLAKNTRIKEGEIFLKTKTMGFIFNTRLYNERKKTGERRGRRRVFLTEEIAKNTAQKELNGEHTAATNVGGGH